MQPSLGLLAKTLLKQIPEIRRLRLSSIDSIEADGHLMDLIADEPRFMPHLHLSLQHGDDMILKRMKRRHSRADAIRFIDDVRRLRPEMSFGADMIAGFPTETEAMFENAVSLAEETGIAHLHVFPYSPRPGTPAARMPQLDRTLIKERAARLRLAGQKLHQSHLDSYGRHAAMAARGEQRAGAYGKLHACRSARSSAARPCAGGDHRPQWQASRHATCGRRRGLILLAHGIFMALSFIKKVFTFGREKPVEEQAPEEVQVC